MGRMGELEVSTFGFFFPGGSVAMGGVADWEDLRCAGAACRSVWNALWGWGQRRGTRCGITETHS